ncbi:MULTISPECIES: YdcF family protein [Apibacter]|uniref:YdcF family protein n=1 Tax=Apibacter TaxID=1778601 RepID=UPI001C6A4541|nr:MULTISPECIES: YdcF family protein [Apibacter]QYN50839.1 YdcF family protein [Apibacter sp. ESL0404]
MSYYRKLIKYIITGIILLFLWFILHTIAIIIDGNQEDTRDADVGVIFGTKNKKDGSMPMSLIRRLNIGLKLYNEGQVQKLIVSGGLANKNFCEADLMQEYLLEHGVLLSDIILDNKALNTEENVENSLKIMKDNNYRKLIIISQYYHISRIKLMYYKLGFYNLGSASSHHYSKRHHYMSLIREFFAYYYYYFFK